EDIESFDCDVFFTINGSDGTNSFKQYQSFCLKLDQSGSVPLLYAYPIQDSSVVFYMVGTELFFYADGVLTDFEEYMQPPQESEEETEETTDGTTVEPEKIYQMKKVIDFNIEEVLMLIHPIAIALGYSGLEYAATYPATNRSTFTAPLESEANTLFEELGIENINNEQIDIELEATQANITIEADNQTKMPVILATDFTVAMTATYFEIDNNGDPETEETIKNIDLTMQIKFVFNKINKPLSLDYPDEVKTYLQENYPDILGEETTTEEE
ncbi:MAG: hypothetical protein PHI19_07900, partial [Clostridia bacterium]|nr:hypothetical protein [Clostridia bacterium]